VDGIDDVINTGDNLPEWCQEKIAVAKSMLVTVWDYMLSEKESFDIGMGQASHGKAGADVAEGWSDAMVARRTGTPRTPYSVYIKGKKWKDFENDDHAEAVANKLKAKFKADGRDPSVITIAPTDIPEGMAETVTDTRVGMAQIYRKLAPKIERYKDSFLAGQLYDELENYAELHGAEKEFKQMMNGARNRAHMDYDTNPGGFQNWFWYLPFADEDITEESQDDRNARIIAGEIEDAMSLGNEKVAQEKIKRLTQLGYYFDKQGRLQRMGMYEEQDACYRKVKSRYKVWPSAYASGALVQCRKKGAANWGNKTKK
jgi:hypothetical protein